MAQQFILAICHKEKAVVGIIGRQYSFQQPMPCVMAHGPLRKAAMRRSHDNQPASQLANQEANPADSAHGAETEVHR